MPADTAKASMLQLINISIEQNATVTPKKMDIARYFPSIDHALLKRKLRFYLKDQKLFGLLDSIIDSSQSEIEYWIYFPGDDFLNQAERPLGMPNRSNLLMTADGRRLSIGVARIEHFRMPAFLV